MKRTTAYLISVGILWGASFLALALILILVVKSPEG